MKIQYKFLSIILACGLLTACSSDEPTVGREGMNSAVITAGINNSASRANSSQWEADDIGVTVIDAPNSDMEALYRNVRYKTDALGGSAVFAPVDNEGIFFQETSETVTFSAYGPYRDWTVAPDVAGFNTVDMADSQMGREAQKSIDFIHASGATASNASPTVTFSGANAFRHVMSRLEIVVKISGKSVFSANALTDGDYSLGGMKLQALFNPYTGEAKASDAPAVNDWYLNTLPSATGDGIVSYTAILPPQTLATALTFTAKVDGQTYQTDLSIGELKSGTNYRINITVTKTAMTVTGCSISGWGNGGEIEGEVSPVIPIGDKNADEAAIGDFYMNDGSLVDKDATLTDEQLAACIGIVFTTDVNRIGEGAKAALAAKGVTPHGLVMALTDAADNVRWGVINVDETGLNNYQQLKDTYSNIEGYSETQWIIHNHSNKLLDEYTAFYYVSIYGKTEETIKYAAPYTSTGWFLPSGGNWWDILRNLGQCEALDNSRQSGSFNLYNGSAAPSTIEHLNSSVSKFDYASIFNNHTYWSSSEYDQNAARQFYLDNDGLLSIANSDKSRSANTVRCVLAF